jgi:alkylhydroperoxidase family enzyme
MPRVTEIDEDRGDPILREVFEAQRSRLGGVLNPAKIMAHCPPILRAAQALGAAIEQSGQLPKGLLPLVYLRVATLNGCPF